MALSSFRRLVARVAVGALAVAVPVVLTPLPASAAPASDLFISEYVEGSSNNKALEIFNGTGAAVNLATAGYNVQVFFNGSAAAGLTVNLTGTVADGDAFVLAQASAAAAVLAVADQTNGAGWYNGDDAVALRRGTTVVDVLGQIGTDPGTEWGTGLTSTADNTLRRQATFCGDTDGADAFDPATEWDGFAVDTFDGLGSHTANCPTPPDAAPSVTEVTPADGATAAAGANVVVTFSEDVTAPASAFGLACAGSTVPFSLGGGPRTFTLDPSADLPAGAACTLTVTGSGVSDVDANDPPDTMAATFTSGFTVASAPTDPCTLPTTTIGAVQGTTETSPAAGSTVTVRGVVVGDHDGPAPALRGFYLQDAGDGDPATSDGIFVFTNTANLVSLGDTVTVRGSVSEFQGQTQITPATGGVAECADAGPATPADVSLPVASPSALERHEGMLVRFQQPLYVTEHFQLGRFGQVTMSGTDRLDQPTNVLRPGVDTDGDGTTDVAELQAANNLNRIIVDDTNQAQNADPIAFGRGGQPLSASNTLRGGDTLTGAVGVMTYTWGGASASPNAYRLRPVANGGSFDFQAVNARPSAREDVGGDVQVAAMNLLNYFDTFTGCSFGVGAPPTNSACRGANNATEFDRQWPKTVAAIAKVDPDVLGVNEIENDGYADGASAIDHLVDRLNDALGEGTFAYLDVDDLTGQTNALGTDAIKVGMIYKPSVVTPIGQTAALNDIDFVGGGDGTARSRPSLAQAFRVNATGGTFVADINHFKSKGSACNAPDAGDGQGNCNAVRTRSAQELAEWLATDPTGTGEADTLVLGDLNSYAKEDPIRTLEEAGFTNLVEEYVGDEAYSYVFDGQWGYLDHALGSAGILSQVTDVTEYHVNADEPSVLDYNTDFKTANQVASLYAPDEFRVSDHDPIVVGLKPNSAPTVTAAFTDTSVPCGTGNASLRTSWTDRDGADTHAVTVAWGDGTADTTQDPASSPLTLSHTYAAAGRYTATVTVTDSHGLSTTETAEVVVEYTSTGILPPLGSGTTVRYGSVVPVKVAYTDCDGSVPTDLAPTVSVTLGSTVVATGTTSLVKGEWKYELNTRTLPNPTGTYTVTVTVPETGQTDSASLRLRR
ncbi:ExeM/NucH family extracellular endonuclease [Oryzobacter sp. R7]|uniref:ExeM/NucH family extracellular endonuclease n=1 Tax=Oryzobacter faecalis TaxID=3388656 RepID=UPI00398CF9DA